MTDRVRELLIRAAEKVGLKCVSVNGCGCGGTGTCTARRGERCARKCRGRVHLLLFIKEMKIARGKPPKPSKSINELLDAAMAKAGF